jgi:hypothetical protein
MIDNSNIISTVSYDQLEILENILKLYVPSGVFDVDPTYSKGNFYKSGRIPQPTYKFDLYPQVGMSDDVEEASSTDLPLGAESVNSINFDPPFVIGGQTYKAAKDGSCITAKRFGNFVSWDELRTMYGASLAEFYRILKPNGVLVFKCQDCVAGGKQHMSHAWIMYKAVELGFYPKDLFVLVAKNRVIDGRFAQQHARKFHSYFWVFLKTDSKIDYSL